MLSPLYVGLSDALVLRVGVDGRVNIANGGYEQCGAMWVESTRTC